MKKAENSKKLNSNAVISALSPTVNMIVLVTGLVVWAFNTFAQISYVKEQNQQLLSLVEQRHRDAIDHSDMNRERMMSVLMEVKETVKSLEAIIIAQARRSQGVRHEN